MRCSRLILNGKIYGLPTLVHLRQGRECSPSSQLDAEDVLVPVTGRLYSQGLACRIGARTKKISEGTQRPFYESVIRIFPPDGPI